MGDAALAGLWWMPVVEVGCIPLLDVGEDNLNSRLFFPLNW